MSKEKENQYLILVRENQHRIQKFCAMYSNNKEERKDLEQEVLLNIWKSFSQFRGESMMNTWVYRIILNVCIKHTYSIKQKIIISIEDLGNEVSSENLIEENYQNLYDCIQSLEFSDKTIILLFLEGLPYISISEIIGISENYVAVKIKRIKEKLLTCLNKVNNYE